jgi:hypothetical protein
VDLYIHSPIRLHGVELNKLSTGTTLPYIIRRVVRQLVQLSRLPKLLSKHRPVWTRLLLLRARCVGLPSYNWSVSCVKMDCFSNASETVRRILP